MTRVFPNHKYGIAASSAAVYLADREDGLCLLDEAEQRAPALRGRPAIARRLVGFVRPHDLLAQRLQLGVADAVELHAQVEDRDRHQLRRIKPAIEPQRRPAFLEGCEYFQQLFV